MSMYYDVHLSNKLKVIVKREDVPVLIKQKADGLDFVQAANGFINPQWIIAILPNYDHGNDFPKGDGVPKPDTKLLAEIRALTGGAVKRIGSPTMSLPFPAAPGKKNE